MKKYLSFYLVTLLLFAAAVLFVLHQGRSLQSGDVQRPVVGLSTAASQAHFFSNIENNTHHPLAILVLQIFCIMIVARVFGHLITKIGQPSVVGEILAGIALGPSLLGFVFPEFSAFLFPVDSLPRLHVLSQMGLIFFMFIIGMELDMGVLKKKAKDAIVVSHISIVFPYFLGVVLAYFLYASFAPRSIPFSAFALFMGIAMSITAFPVLARIVQERNLTGTPIGTIAITCAAADDITAWCLLALVIAIVSAGGIISAVGSIILSVAYVFFMWLVVRPILSRMAVKYDTPEIIDKTVVAIIFGIMLLSSYLTEIIGIHALFGAFLAGTIMPEQKIFKLILAEKIEDISLVLFLPLFFVFTGLRTQIGLLNEPHLWGMCLLIIGVAVVGKFLGSAVAARFVGQNWKDSLLIGILMNTRGLMELVVLNIGYDLGVLSAEIFTMMVLMALTTTFMTGPAITAIEFLFKSRKGRVPRVLQEGFNTLLSFGSPQSGSRLLELACSLNLKNEKDSSVTAIHFSPNSEISLAEAEQYEKDAFFPIRCMAEHLGVSLSKVFRVTDHVERAILETISEAPYNLILLGESRQIFSDEKTGGKIRTIMHETDASIGIFVDRGFRNIERILVVLSTAADIFLIRFAKRFLEDNGTHCLTILDPKGLLGGMESGAKMGLKGNFSVLGELPDEGHNLETTYDMAMVSFEFWMSLRRGQGSRFGRMPSVLIINK